MNSMRQAYAGYAAGLTLHSGAARDSGAARSAKCQGTYATHVAKGRSRLARGPVLQAGMGQSHQTPRQS